jgi:prepilin-type N-terminal cleavage/methylation domain-containing protein
MNTTRYQIRDTSPVRDTLRQHKSGMTLFEVMIAVVLVGLAMVSLIGSNIAFTRANGVGTEMTTAEFLAEQIREMTALLPVYDPGITNIIYWTSLGTESGESLSMYDDVDDFNGKTFSPPINSNRNTLSEFSGYSQHITVQKVSASNFETVLSDSATGTSFIRVTVKIYLNSKLVSTTSWLRAKYN